MYSSTQRPNVNTSSTRVTTTEHVQSSGDHESSSKGHTSSTKSHVSTSKSHMTTKDIFDATALPINEHLVVRGGAEFIQMTALQMLVCLVVCWTNSFM